MCSLKIPVLGDHYDKLNWPKIRSIIRYIFKNTKIKVDVVTKDKITPKSEDILEI